VYVSAGDSVSEGDVLAELDDSRLRAELSQLQSQLEARLASLALARATAPITRQREDGNLLRAQARQLEARAVLREQIAAFGLGESVDSVLERFQSGRHTGLDRAVAGVLTAKADSAQAAADAALSGLAPLSIAEQEADRRRLVAAIAAARVELERLRVLAPAAGIVGTDTLERLPGAAVTEGEVLLEVVEGQIRRADLFVSQASIHEVAPGDPSEVEIAALQRGERRTIRGHVVSAALEPVRPASVGQDGLYAGAGAIYRVTIRLDSLRWQGVDPGMLRVGYVVRGRVITDHGPVVTMLGRYLRRGR
jgi:multidrug resistance efflux pump